jgi:hypothetical protein
LVDVNPLTNTAAFTKPQHITEVWKAWPPSEGRGLAIASRDRNPQGVRARLHGDSQEA